MSRYAQIILCTLIFQAVATAQPVSGGCVARTLGLMGKFRALLTHLGSKNSGRSAVIAETPAETPVEAYRKKVTAIVESLTAQELLQIDPHDRIQSPVSPQIIRNFPGVLKEISDPVEFFRAVDVKLSEVQSGRIREGNDIEINSVLVSADRTRNVLRIDNLNPRQRSTSAALSRHFFGHSRSVVENYLIGVAYFSDAREIFEAKEIDLEYIAAHRDEINQLAIEYYVKSGCWGAIEKIRPQATTGLAGEWTRLEPTAP